MTQQELTARQTGFDQKLIEGQGVQGMTVEAANEVFDMLAVRQL